MLRRFCERFDSACNQKLAEQLVEKYGIDMAPSLHQLQTILPFSRAQMFTAGWGAKYQAHKILEKAMWKDVFDRTDFEKLPAIILKDTEHKVITAKIEAARKRLVGKATPTKEQLWKIYQDAYKTDPEWLVAIKHYFE